MRLFYKPFGVAFGMLGARAASALFERLWRIVDRQAPAPEATLKDSSWGKVLAAAAIGGLTQRVVAAVVDRAGAQWFERYTGAWPGRRTADTPPR